jgi:N6-L-threonylcarbamoyladenine synthase
VLVVGLESSCDETAAALLEVHPDGKTKLLAEGVSSQISLHAQYGGVVPELASREHLRNFPLVLDKVLQDAGVGLEAISHVGVTSGPGLKGCLLIGVGFARGFAMARGLPLLGINHIEGHLLAAKLEHPELEFPFLALVVSGGHTELIEVRSLGNYHVLARTIDDAAGEAFDKSAHLLGLPYPGGPELARLAEGADEKLRDELFKALPKVMREAEGFSFSGLKTAIALLVKREANNLAGNPLYRAALASAIQDSILEALLHKVKLAIKATQLKQFVVTGGVAANRELRKRVQSIKGVKAFFPSPEHCVDNAAMIAYVAGLRFAAGQQPSYSPEIKSRWPVEACGTP